MFWGLVFQVQVLKVGEPNVGVRPLAPQETQCFLSPQTDCVAERGSGVGGSGAVGLARSRMCRHHSAISFSHGKLFMSSCCFCVCWGGGESRVLSWCHLEPRTVVEAGSQIRCQRSALCRISKHRLLFWDSMGRPGLCFIQEKKVS